MKKIILLITAIVLFFSNYSYIFAQDENFAEGVYIISDFSNKIEIQSDTSILVTENITVYFPDYRHGIYRVIPVNYTANGKTIRSRFSVVSITDQNGKNLDYKRERRTQSVSLKIGDPDTTVTGYQSYEIKYMVTKVLQRFDDHDELYWNVSGSYWDTDIVSTEAYISTPYANIDKVRCFTGILGSRNEDCLVNIINHNEAVINSTAIQHPGEDFTVVVGLNKDNGLVFPSKSEIILSNLLDNWGYLLSILPLFILFVNWLKKGRDKKYAGDNIYYQPDNSQEVTKPLFAKEFLPTVYHPIASLTPSQLGTIVDEKVDIHDVVAEIIELARLGFIKLEKIEKDKLIGKVTDYSFTKIKEGTSGLTDFQSYLLDKLFADKALTATITALPKLYKKDERKLNSTLKLANDNKLVLLSGLKNNFYTSLDKFKDKLYQSTVTKGLFAADPEKVRSKWIGIFILMDIAGGAILFKYFASSGNFSPLIVLGLLSLPAFFLAYSMPRKTAWGYSLYRQAKGLAFYLEKGKWRHEIAEKRLFFEEMIPLAISLGVLNKLARDMQELGVKPPDYFGGFTTASLYSDISGFETKTASTLVSAPGGKGSSSWSGGSGFSGGSGGGFGGGGGGSW